MKKFIPAIIAIALILIVVAGSFGMKLKEKYSYSDEQQNLEEYYDLIFSHVFEILFDISNNFHFNPELYLTHQDFY